MNLTWLFVGAVYAIAVFLARRALVDLPRRVALFFYALVLVFMFKPMTQGYVNIAVDFVKTLPPWAYPLLDLRVENSELNDLPLQIVPWAHQVRESWKSFQAPLWNHMNGAGYPLAGNGQSSPFSLVRFLALPLELGRAMTAEAAMKLLIALTFTFLYCRYRGRSELASVVAAVTFAFSGFMVGWLHFPMATAACFAPAVLFGIDRLSERQSYGRIVFFAAIWCLMLFAGHPETAGHLFWLAGIYALWVTLVERRGGMRLAGALLGAFAISALLAAPYLGPLLEAIPKSRRYLEVQETGLTVTNLPWVDLPCAILLIQPNFFGQVPFDKPWGPAMTEPLGGYAGVFGLAAWLAVFLNVIATRNWRSRELFYSMATLFVLGAFMAWPGFSDLFHLTMPLAAHARLRLLFVLLLAIQSAYAIDLARRLPMLTGLFAVSMTLLLLLQIPLHYGYRIDTAVLAMLPSIAVLLVATYAAFRRTRFAVMALLVAVTAELFILGMDRNPVLMERVMYPDDKPLLRALDRERAKLPPNEPFRTSGMGPAFFPNVNVLYGYEDIRVHDPMAYRRYMGFLAHTGRYDVEGYFAFWDDGDSPTLDYLNVRYLVTEPRIEVRDPDHMKRIYDGPDGRIYENQRVLPRFFAVRNIILEFRDEVFSRLLEEHREWSDTALIEQLEIEAEPMRNDFFKPRPPESPLATTTIVDANPTDYRIRTNAPRWSLVVSSIPWWHGWKIERNGKRIEPIKVNAIFLGFAVPPGQSEVRVWYSPWMYWVGVWIFGVTVAALGFVGWKLRVRNEVKGPVIPNGGTGAVSDRGHSTGHFEPVKRGEEA